MADKIEKILVPDIGGAEDVDVIDVLVSPGDTVAKEDSLITLEGDKATMEVPSPQAGVVESVTVKVGDKVSEGSAILTLKLEGSSDTPAKAEAPKAAKKDEKAAATSEEATAERSEAINVPDIGGASDVDVIEILVSVGDTVAKEASLITLEGDKATMEVPSPEAGVVESIALKVGDKVSEGSKILMMKITGGAAKPATKSAAAPSVASKPQVAEAPVVSDEDDDQGDVHAGPGVRRIAHEFGIPLEKIRGTGAKGRILKEDVQKYVKQQLKIAESGGAGAGFNFPPAPKVDFSKFGKTSSKPLSKIQKFSGASLHRNWVSIPHITQFEEVDITEMEASRQAQKSLAAEQGFKLTPLVFVMKAVVAALKEFPHFNASLDPSGESLIMKEYFNIGVAVDTPNGLVVPVIRDVDKKGLFDLAKELGEISKKAREEGLGLADMQGGCFTISSLGGIGGTAFTPIINAPEVAILGVSKSAKKLVYQPSSDDFESRLMLPLSLSYDHRVIDGADGARFIVYLAKCLADRTLML